LRFLVSGATGFVGSHIVIKLLDPGPVKLAFEKSIRWFKENGYVKN
jgi:nucleoside-diphosphate-sugar epimerase